MPERELVASRIALLELKDERAAAREGFELLDEKRVTLATRILQRLGALEALRRDWRAREEAARATLRAVLARHGWLGVRVHPARDATATLARTAEPLLGLELVAATLAIVPWDWTRTPVVTSREATACADAFARLAECGAALAAVEASLRRLVREFRRTERRARAIENVLLPEIEAAISRIDAALEGVEQEEAIRVRRARG